MEITRFAPSPTGFLHVGNLRTAIISWLVAKSTNGKFILRIDDTDIERSKLEYEESIIEDLQWMGLFWDRLEHQSKRFDIYEQAKQKLITAGRLYPCYETPEELELKKKILINRGLPPIYDREALSLSEAQKQKFTAEGRTPHWRFKLQDETITWNDGVRGFIHFEAKNLSDPIFIRNDGSLTYSIASVVDDIDFGITHIVRGEDHISNSAIHIQIFEALGAKFPKFSHVSLLKTKERNLSKRDGGFDVKSLRQQGILPIVILSYLSKLGSADAIHYEESVEKVIQNFALEKFSKSTCTYSPEDLTRLNQSYIHNMEYKEAQIYLADSGLQHITAEFWYSIRGNISNISETALWWKICTQAITPVIEDIDYTKKISLLLPEGELTSATWSIWINTIKDTTNKKGPALFMPIRLALTGQHDGPELSNILALIGRDKAIQRLNGKTI